MNNIHRNGRRYLRASDSSANTTAHKNSPNFDKNLPPPPRNSVNSLELNDSDNTVYNPTISDCGCGKKLAGFAAPTNTAYEPQSSDERYDIEPADAVPVIITNEAGLIAIGTGTDTSYKLGGNITLTTSPWVPIERATGDPIVFDGQGYSIFGLTRPLFMKLPAGSTAKNVTLSAVNMEILATENTLVTVGGFVCDGNSCTLNGVNVTGSIQSWHDTGIVGGVVGDTNGAFIQNCTSNTTIISRQYGGGIAGQSSGNFKSCINYGGINSGSWVHSLASRFGGIVGSATSGDIGYLNEGCINFGTINTIQNTTHTGGIVGLMSGNAAVSYCTSAGNVTGGSNVGGIVGGDGKVNYCVVTGITIKGYDRIGGIMGFIRSGSSISNCVCGAASVEGISPGDQRVGRIAQSSDKLLYNNTAFFTKNCANGNMKLVGKYYYDFTSHEQSMNGPLSSLADYHGYGATRFHGENCNTAGTIIPQWTIIFNNQNGSPNSTSSTDSSGNLADFPDDPTPPDPSNMTFLGWFDQPVGGTQYTAPYDFTGNKTLYAQYKCNDPAKSYNVNTQTCDTRMYTVKYTVFGYPYGDETVVHGGKVTPPTPPTVDNATFAGWYNTANDTKWNVSLATVSSDLTLDARYTCNDGYHLDGEDCVLNPSNTCQVSFAHPNGIDSAVPPPKQFTCGQTFYPPAPSPAPQSPYHTFDGWYTAPFGGTKWVFGTDTTLTSITLYSHWNCGMGFTELPNSEECKYVEGECDAGWTDSDDKSHCVVKITFPNADGSESIEKVEPGGKVSPPQISNTPNGTCAWYKVGENTPFDFDTPITGPIEFELRCTCNIGFEDNGAGGCTFTGNCPSGYHSDGTKCQIIVEIIYPNGKPPEYEYIDIGSEFIFPEGPTTPHGKFIGWSVQPMTGALAEPFVGSDGLYQPGEKISVPAPLLIIPVFQGDPGWSCDGNGNCVFSGSCPPGYELNEDGDDCVSDGSGGGGNGGGSITLPQNIVNALGNVMDSIGNMENAAGDLLGSYKLMFDKSLTFSKNPETDMVETSHMVERMVEALSELESSLSSKLCCSVKVLSACGCAETR
jgi:hypothetical protein